MGTLAHAARAEAVVRGERSAVGDVATEGEDHGSGVAPGEGEGTAEAGLLEGVGGRRSLGTGVEVLGREGQGSGEQQRSHGRAG